VTRVEWLSVLAQARAETVARLAALVEREVAVETTRAPAPGLLLATVRESVDGNLFHPGEILVTSCEVRAGACLGASVILGADLEKARGCAVVDAGLQQEFASRSTVIQNLIDERWWRRQAQRDEEEMVRSTVVHFETMDPQR
jgi:phosphonate C-P lyase system protein PhnG